MVRLAVHALLICAAAAVLMWGTTSGLAGVFIGGAAPESGWSTAGELSEEHKHCHDTSAGTVDSVAIEVVRYFEALADQSLLVSSVGECVLLPPLRGPPCI